MIPKKIRILMKVGTRPSLSLFLPYLYESNYSPFLQNGSGNSRYIQKFLKSLKETLLLTGSTPNLSTLDLTSFYFYLLSLPGGHFTDVLSEDPLFGGTLRRDTTCDPSLTDEGSNYTGGHPVTGRNYTRGEGSRDSLPVMHRVYSRSGPFTMEVLTLRPTWV